MKYVVKLGGAGLENPALLEGCTRAIVELVRDGNQVAVVHGGGVQLTQTLMVLAGKVNKRLVAALGALGQPAVGMSGGDGLLFRARKKRTAPDLGFVGEIAASDPRWLEAIWQLNGVPVLCSLALGFDGEYYNINADEMAAACAVACGADALVFLTDVPGVKDAKGAVLRWLSIDQIAEMAKSAVITGGMLPKLGACREALLNGVKRVRILPAEAAGSLPDLCSSRVAHGTEVMVA
jgi:acetylglutamate kinase